MANRRTSHLRHASYYYSVTAQAEQAYRDGKQLEGLALFDRERRQIDAGWQWAMAQAGLGSGVSGIAAAAATPDPRPRTPDPDIDRLLLDFANATAYVGDVRYDVRRERIPQLEAQRDAARRLEHKEAQGMALGNLGFAYDNLGEVQRAIETLEQALVISREIGDRQGEGNALGNLGLAYDNLGEYPRAIAYYEQSVAVKQVIGDVAGVASSWNLGLLYEGQGELARAVPLMQIAVDFYRSINHAQYAEMTADKLAEVKRKLAEQDSP